MSKKLTLSAKFTLEELERINILLEKDRVNMSTFIQRAVMKVVDAHIMPKGEVTPERRAEARRRLAERRENLIKESLNLETKKGTPV